MSDFQPQTTFYLLRNIKIDHSNTNQILFDSKEQQQAYFMSHKAYEVLEGTYQRKTIGVINVPFLYDDIADCNYVMWQNANYSNKWYYAFILDIKYTNPNVSQIVYDLDVIQTYMFDVEFKECYINRQHEQRYETGYTPVINREVEDLEYGADYDTIKEVDLQQLPNVSFLVLGYVGDATLGIGGRQLSRIPFNLIYLIVPVYVSHAETTIPEVTFTINGNALTNASTIFDRFKTNQTLVNSLVSAKLYPFLPGEISGSLSGTTYALTSSVYGREVLLASGENLYCMVASYDNNFIGDYFELISDKYEPYNYEESKLLMFPYSYGVLTTKRGNDFIVKFEDLEAKSVSIFRQGSISNQPKIAYIVCNYHAKDNAKKLPSSMGDYYYDQTQGINEVIENDFPIIDDYTASYLQANSNSIKVSQSNAKLLQQSSLEQANNTYNTGSNVRDIKAEQASRNLTYDIGQVALSASANVARSANVSNFAGVGTSGILETASGTLGAIQTKQNADDSIRMTALQEQNNLKNANISANTDYQASIATINAKVQDASCVPPTAKSLGGDYVFDIIHDCDGIYFQWKTIQPYYAEKLSNYFKMYGYAVNKLGIPNLYTRENWNYIKLIQANIFGNIPQSDLMKIRDIYMEGFTLWHIADVGNYDYNNSECPDNSTVTIAKDDNVSSTTPSVGDKVFETNSSVIMTAIANEGYYIKGWYDHQFNCLIEGADITIKAHDGYKYTAQSAKIGE